MNNNNNFISDKQRYFLQEKESQIQSFKQIMECLEMQSKPNIDNSLRLEITSNLNNLKYDALSYFDKFLEFLNNNEFSSSLRLQFILYLKNIFQKVLISEKESNTNCINVNKINESGCIKTLNALFSALMTGKFKDKELNNICTILELLFNYNLVYSNRKIVKDFVKYVLNTAKNLINKEDNNDFLIIINSILQSIFSSLSINKDNYYELVSDTVDIFNISIKTYFERVKNTQIKINNIDYSNNITSNLIKDYVDLINKINSIILKLNKIFLSLKKKLSNNKLNNDNNNNLLSKCLDLIINKHINSNFELLYFQFLNVTTSNIIVSLTNNYEVDNCINILKANIYKNFNLLINKMPDNYLLNTNELNETEISNSIYKEELSNKFVNLWNITINNLKFLIDNKQEILFTPDEGINEYPKSGFKFLLYHQLMYINRIINRCELISYFEGEYFYRLFIEITLPLLQDEYLIINKSMSYVFDNDEYVNLIDDIISEQSSKTIRCVAAFTLQEICNNFNRSNSLVKIVEFIVQSIYYLLNFGFETLDNYNQNLNLLDYNIKKVFENRSYLKEYYDYTKINNVVSLFFCLPNKEIQLNILLMSLCIINNIAMDDTCSLSEYLKLYINNNFITKLIETNSIIIKSALITFIKYYGILLYSNDDNSLYIILNFLFEQLDCNERKISSLVSYSILIYLFLKSLNCISHILSDYKNHSLPSVNKIIDNNLMKIINNLDLLDNKCVFDIILEIISNFNLNYEVLTAILDKISIKINKLSIATTRILFKSHSSCANKQVLMNSMLIKCFAIFRVIVDKKDYVTNNYVS